MENKNEFIKIEMTNGKIIYAEKVVIGVINGHMEGQEPPKRSGDGVDLGILVDGSFGLKEIASLHHHLDVQLMEMGKNQAGNITEQFGKEVEEILANPEKMEQLNKGIVEILSGLKESLNSSK